MKLIKKVPEGNILFPELNDENEEKQLRKLLADQKKSKSLLDRAIMFRKFRDEQRSKRVAGRREPGSCYTCK